MTGTVQLLLPSTRQAAASSHAVTLSSLAARRDYGPIHVGQTATLDSRPQRDSWPGATDAESTPTLLLLNQS
jgi:hypothetical protein